MRVWKRERTARENADRALLHLGRVLTRSARLRYEALPAVQVGHEHVSSTRVVPDRAALLALMPSGGTVAEIGVDRGEFSERILRICSPRVLHLVDPWSSERYGAEQEAEVRRRFSDAIDSGRVSIHRARSLEFLATIPDRALDWAYVDSDHTYETTRAELLALEAKVSPDGMIAGHDYTVGNWFGSYRFGVVEAVNQFCVERGWGFVAITHESDRHLSFALRRLEVSGSEGPSA